MKFGEPTMGNINENLPQENGDDNVNADFELDEKTSVEMENSIDEIPEIKRWNSGELGEEEKMDEIEKRKSKIESAAEKMGLELKEEIGEIESQIKDFRDSLKDKYEEYGGMEDNLNQIRGENTEEREGLNKMRETLSSLKGIYENQLEIEYLEYWKKYKEDPELLLESHAKRNLVMNNWEILIENLKTAEEGEEEILKAWAQWVKNNPEITLAALALAVAAGATMGALLGPEIAAFLATIGEEQVTEEVIKEVAKEAGPAAAKTSIWVAGKGLVVAGAGIGAGATVSAGILGKALAWISDGRNRDDLAKKLCGTDLPWYAYLASGKPGSEKK